MGIASHDVMTARLILAKATEKNVGITVDPRPGRDDRNRKGVPRSLTVEPRFFRSGRAPVEPGLQ